MTSVAHRRQVRQRIDVAATKAHTKLIARALKIEGQAVRKATATASTPAEWSKAAVGAISTDLWIATISSLWLSDQMMNLWDTQQAVFDSDYPMNAATKKRITRYAASHGKLIAEGRRDRMATLATRFDPDMKARDRLSPSRQFRSTMRTALREEYTTVAANTATRIAWTETLQATETIRYESSRTAAERSKLRIRKVWFTMSDNRVRDSHVKVNGKSRFVDHRGWGGKPGLFTVGSDRLRHPRDPRGSPGEIVNCRCFLEMRKVRAK